MPKYIDVDQKAISRQICEQAMKDVTRCEPREPSLAFAGFLALVLAALLSWNQHQLNLHPEVHTPYLAPYENVPEKEQ
jgi:hypothetical protein